jgi:DNA polymerase III subunit epsilon
MILFFDTETTGLPNNWKAAVTDIDNWPRLVQIAWKSFEDDGIEINSKDYIIKPEGFLIPMEASNVHGITTELALVKGKDLIEILSELNIEIDKARTIVAHNMNFDAKVIGAEMVRKKFTSNLFSKHLVCTMESSTNYCKIPGNYGFKWPRLSELHIKLFGEDFQEAHNASKDVQVTAKCFWELKKLGEI